MARRSRIAKLAKALSQAIFPTLNPFGAFMPRSRFNFARSVGSGLSNSVIVALLKWLQRNFTQATFRVRAFDSDGKLQPLDRASKLADEQAAIRMVDLIKRPNMHYSGRQLWKATLLSYELDGNAYWIKVKNRQGMVIQLWWIPHTLIEPKRLEGSTNYVDHYEYTPGNGATIELQPEDVVHFRDGIDPDNTAKGFSAFRSLLRELFTDDEAANFTASLLRNMGVPGIVVSPDADDNVVASEEDVKETKRFFQQATTGDNRGEPIVMTAPTKLQTFGFNPQQMDLRQLRRVPEERASAVVGIPAIVAGLGAGLDRSTFSNMAEARKTAAEEKLVPTGGDLADTVGHQLLPDFVENPELYECDFDVTGVLALSDNKDKLATRMVTLAGGPVLTVAEAREELGFESEPEHEIYLRNFNLIEVPAGESGRTIDESEPAPPKGLTKREAPKLTRKQQAALTRGMRNNSEPMVAPFAQKLEDRFTKLADDAARIWRGYMPKADTAGSLTEHRTLTASDPEIQAAQQTLKRLNIPDTTEALLRNDYAKHYAQIADRTIKTAESTLGIVVNAPDYVKHAVTKAGGMRKGLVDLAEQTKTNIFDAITDGVAAGEGADAIERRVRQYVSGGGKADSHVNARAMRIARSETRYAQNIASVETYTDMGFEAFMVLDNRTGFDDDDCMAVDGTIVGYDEAQSLMDEEHPNGTRDFAPATEDQVRGMDA